MTWEARRALEAMLHAEKGTSKILTLEQMQLWTPNGDGGLAAMLELEAKNRFKALTLRQLVEKYPTQRKPVIHGVSREGETVNVIASPKIGKSWFVNDLALAVATGADWLGVFPVERGEVLIVDNELHHESSAHRIPMVADARGINLSDCADQVHISNVRGLSFSVPLFGSLLGQYKPGQLKVVIVDAWYRALPGEVDENDNGAIKDMYNWVDKFALEYGCSFVLIHHASKGSQSGKSVTDVGSGAGSQSRAADTHLILRPHEQPNCVVLEAVVRSWAPIEPRVLRWTFPVWNPADDLDPADLKPDRPPPRAKKAKETKADKKPEWTRERFVEEIVGGKDGKLTKVMILANAADKGMSDYKAKQWLDQCMAKELLFRWTFGHNDPHQYRTTPQPGLDTPQSRGGVE